MEEDKLRTEDLDSARFHLITLSENYHYKDRIRIYKGNKLLGIEFIPNASTSQDRIKVIKQHKYKRYTRYILRNIKVRRGFDEAGNKGKTKLKKVKINGL